MGTRRERLEFFIGKIEVNCHACSGSIVLSCMMPSIYRKLLACSYNIVGSYEDARDLVQDAMEKFLSANRSGIENEDGYLVRTVVNLSINFKKRQDRFSGYGVWLPEPVSTETPESTLDRKLVARYSLLVLLEQLNAKERAVFILKEGFDYSHEEIAEVLEMSVENSRQLLSRARKKVGAVTFCDSSVEPETGKGLEEQLEPYLAALANADMESLESLLVKDVRVMADGGRNVKVVRDEVSGREEVARLLQSVFALFLDGKEHRFVAINHEPAICFFEGGTLYNCQVFRFDEAGRITNIHSIVDPAKLKNLSF